MLTVLGGRWGGSFGVGGLFAAASLVFFAFIGFDIVATAAAETRNAHKAVPRGILGALVPITVLYVALSLVLTGMVDYTTLATRPDGTTATLASAFALNGVEWAVVVISLGALTGLTTVVLVAMLGQTRVLFAMSRDGFYSATWRASTQQASPLESHDRRPAVALAAAFTLADTWGRWSTSGQCSRSCSCRPV
jgi:basic amino acid/polyamine antiporter, APA family